MCGIAALLLSSSIPAAPSWPFWKGSKQQINTDCSCWSPLTKADIDPLLVRRGPDATLHHTVQIPSVDNPATLHFTQTVLSHRGELETTICRPSGNVILFNGEIYSGLPISEHENDVPVLLELLENAANRYGEQPFGSDVLASLDDLRGPWSLVFWQANVRRLYFARDILGRRSLMLRVIQGRTLELISVPPIDGKAGFVEFPPIGLAYAEVGKSGEISFGLIPRERRCVAPERVLRGNNGELVSGSAKEMYVSFLKPQWLRSLVERQGALHMTLQESAEKFISYFRQSLCRRLVTNREFCPGKPRYGVLFSGGIDSLVIARILDQCLPAQENILLINVAFGKDSHAIAQCPDRLNAVSGLKELRQISDDADRFHISFVDVSPERADETLTKCVRHLLYPCDQPMDASIGTAIWSAAGAKAVSTLQNAMNSSNQERSPDSVRILFSGLGADELMGGYKGRHRTIFRNDGLVGIQREMDADLSRLWFRNLGRDDRLIADHGREVRHPYLDEDLISFVTSLPLVEHVCNLSKPDGIGDKHLLRRAAGLLGFSSEAVSRAKRAIQFGSRSKQVIERKSTT